RRSGLKPLEMLQDESCCSICLGIFQDPVSIHCGHSFCRSCITETWEGLTTNFSCPQCRKTKSRKILRPNRELANVIKAAKRLNLQPVREVEGGENFCEEHQEPLKLFCQDDKKLICLVCDRSKMHHDHSVVPMGEAAQECKVRGLWVWEVFHLTDSLLLFLPGHQNHLEQVCGPSPVTMSPPQSSSVAALGEKALGDGLALPHPKRFKVKQCVLGSRGFTSGWHRWEVEIHGQGRWAIGVAIESVPRDRLFFLNPNEGIWALCHLLNEYKALTSHYNTRLTLRRVPKRIRICLDYEEGRVVFFDAKSKERIFAFPPASFQGERVFPWFMVTGDAQLKLLP
uniref:TRI39 ligase n=1 Tax=Calidris pygmaea TaxID=425635 RepID=A0A8C3JGT3_9CHAR